MAAIQKMLEAENDRAYVVAHQNTGSFTAGVFLYGREKTRYSRLEMMKFFRLFLLPALLLALLTVLLIRQRQEISQLLEITSHIQPIYLLWLGVLELVYLACRTVAIQESYRLFGERQPFLRLYRYHIRGLFYALTTGLGFFAAWGYFFRQMERHGVKRSTYLFGQTSVLLSDYIASALMASGVLWLLFQTNTLPTSAHKVVGFMAAAFAIGFLLMLALLSTLSAERTILSIAFWLRNRWQHLRSKLPLPAETLRLWEGELATIRQHIRSHFLAAGTTLLFTAAANVCLFIIMEIALAASGIHLPWTLAAYAMIIGLIFVVATPTPEGIGTAEIAMTGALVQVGLPLSAALSTTALFRLTTLWFPFLLSALIPLWRTDPT